MESKYLPYVPMASGNFSPSRWVVVMPDNVLFEDKTGQQVRTDLMDKCNLHTILRLPTGIFYAQGVKTNVLFFQRGIATDRDNTDDVWIYDLRTNMPSFGKRTPFTLDTLKPFISAYGDDPNGGADRIDEGEEGRFQKFSRAEIRGRADNLDITWLRDESVDRAEDLPDPDEIAAEILINLQTGTEEMQALMELLEPSAATWIGPHFLWSTRKVIPPFSVNLIALPSTLSRI